MFSDSLCDCCLKSTNVYGYLFICIQINIFNVLLTTVTTKCSALCFFLFCFCTFLNKVLMVFNLVVVPATV